MKWLRHDCELDDHPDVLFAGFWGARITEALCRTSKKFDLGGVLPAKYATASYLAHQLGIDRELCQKGLEDAARINPDAEPDELPLIQRDASGNVTIPGWERLNGENEIEAIRAKARARKERWRASHANGTFRNVPERDGNVTERDGTDVTGDVTGRDVTGRNGTEREKPNSVPNGTVAPSQRKARATKHDEKPFLDMDDSWEWKNISDAYRKAWSEDFPGIDLDEELRKARAWVRSAPAKRRKKDWVRFLAGTWFKNAQDGASKGGNVKSVRDIAEREWQKVIRTANAGSHLSEAAEMLSDRTRDALAQWQTNPVDALNMLNRTDIRDQEVCHRAFVGAWIASPIPIDFAEFAE
jgi:hypothetical protein